MGVRIEPNSEPIAGYRLIERLGGGGFGEVWKAEAPGGLYKAIKFVYGDLLSSDSEDASRPEQELKALSRVKTVRHPYILNTERYDIIDGQLMIVMELADRTLWDRFKECRTQGLVGIPREELLPYMAETAEALDLMNVNFQLQHLDIKPQNLFLVFNHVKVADFGLVKDLGGKGAATITGGVTPVYAAPETFDGYLSQHTDQYSLGIVYQELLTGHRPFAGATIRQLVFQHLQGVPDLSFLPASDRPAVSRALAKSSDDRFPTCMEFVAALKASSLSNPVISMPAAPPLTSIDTPVPPPQPGRPSREPSFLEMTLPPSQLDGTINPSLKTLSVRNKTGHTEHGPLEPVHDVVVPAAKPIIAPWGKKPLAPTPAKPTARKTFSEANQPVGVLQPALVIGLGKLGLDTLVHLRKFIAQQFGQPEMLPQIRMVGIDTDGEALQKAGLGDAKWSMRNHEIVHARLHRPTYYMRRDGELPTNDWMSAKNIFRIAKTANSSGFRSLGRLAFVDNYRIIANALEMELRACCSDDTLHALAKHPDLGLRSQTPRVYIVASLAGTTGSGMFLDAAYVVRHLLKQQGVERAEVVGLFFLPPVQREGIRSLALAHSYAALTELHHYSRPNSVFEAKYDPFNPQKPAVVFRESGPPFDRCFFLNLPDPGAAQETASEAIQLSGEFLFRELATSLGKHLDEARKHWQSMSSMHGAFVGPQFQTFGIYRIVWPRRELIGMVAYSLCKRLVTRWMSKDAKPFAEAIASWALPMWDNHGMRPENLIERHQDLCQSELREKPEILFQRLVNPLASDLTPPPLAPGQKTAAPFVMKLGPAVLVFRELEQALGVPEDCRKVPPNQYEPGTLELALADVSTKILDQSDKKITTEVVRLLEDPKFRLAGAEEALRQLGKIVDDAYKSQESLAKELNDKAAHLYQRICETLDKPPEVTTPVTHGRMFGLGRSKPVSTPGSDLFQLLSVYPKIRYQSLILANVNRIYISMRGHLSDQLREVGFCRQRLFELAGLFDAKPTEDLLTSTNQKLLLPPGCPKIDRAAGSLDKELTAEDLATFDQGVQKIVRKNYRALLEVCMGSSSTVRNLAPQMLDEAKRFLEGRLRGISVAELLLSKDEENSNQELEASLTGAYDEAAPESGLIQLDKQLSFLSIYNDQASQYVAQTAVGLFPELKTVATDRPDEMVFFRELEKISLKELDQLGPIAKEAYRQRSTTEPALLHSREDVADWLMIEVASHNES